MRATPASPRQESERRYYADYERRLAAEIVAMLPDREEAERVLAIVDVIMSLTLKPREPQPPPPDAA
jgi:hypothetical protein